MTAPKVINLTVPVSLTPEELRVFVAVLNEARNKTTSVLLRQKDPQKIALYTSALVALGRIVGECAKAGSQ